jgi:hypothetical protein
MPTIATVIKTSISENPRCCRVAFCVLTLSLGPGSPHTIEWNAYKIRQILPRRSRSIFSPPLQSVRHISFCRLCAGRPYCAAALRHLLSKTCAGVHDRTSKRMNGQRPPIPGSNEPQMVARRLLPIWGRLAGGRPDVTRWRRRWSSTSLGSWTRASFATAGTHAHVRKPQAASRAQSIYRFMTRVTESHSRNCART